MSIDKDKIKHTAKLARISLDENKIDSLSKDLSNIFKFIEKLNKANTERLQMSAIPQMQHLLNKAHKEKKRQMPH